LERAGDVRGEAGRLGLKRAGDVNENLPLHLLQGATVFRFQAAYLMTVIGLLEKTLPQPILV
jgi:hypothetical protein